MKRILVLFNQFFFVPHLLHIFAGETSDTTTDRRYIEIYIFLQRINPKEKKYSAFYFMNRANSNYCENEGTFDR